MRPGTSNATSNEMPNEMPNANEAVHVDGNLDANPSVKRSDEQDPTQIAEFTDAHLKQAMLRSMRMVAILSVAIALVLLVAKGWQTAVLLLVGAAISVSSLWEWQKLMTVILAMLDQQQKPGSARVIIGFFLRLLIAGGVLYVSLKFLHGSVFALIGGLVLAVIALSIEAARLVRS